MRKNTGKAIVGMFKLFVFLLILKGGYWGVTKLIERSKIDNFAPLVEGEHLLRKLNVRKHSESNISGGFIFGTGGVSGSAKDIEKVRFSWQIPNGDYVISDFDIDKVRIRFDSTVVEPYVKFTWNPSPKQFSLNHINNNAFYKNIINVVVFCKEEDYVIDFNLNDL